MKDWISLYDWFQRDIEPIIVNRPITKWDDLKIDTDYEDINAVLNFNGETHRNDRVSIDEGKAWHKPKHIKIVTIDGCAFFIKKSTPFQLWL